jgi:D-tyrosyl-tRNA(Tyr) deacylase
MILTVHDSWQLPGDGRVDGVRGLVQRVVEASVTVDGEIVGAIGPGLCLLVGVTHTDTPATATALADKAFHLRVLDDGAGRPDRSLADVAEPAVLVVSQFTLYADTSRGRRPSWQAAAPGPVAEPLVDAVTSRLAALGCTVATGRFGAFMLVSLVGDGPITVLLEV